MSIVLNDTDKKLEVLLSGAVAANELPFTASYADYVDATPAFTPGANDGVTNGVTPVELVGVPGASTQRLVNNISIYNKDTSAATVTIQYEHGAVHREIVKVELAVGYSLHFREDQWQVLNTTGCVQMSMGGSVFSDAEGDPSAINPDDAAADGTSAYAARRDHEHQFTCAVPVDTGVANAEGAATTSARSNHVHKLHDHDHTGDVGDGAQISHDTALTNVSVDDHHAQDHKDRHDPADGADPLDTAAAAEIAGVQAAAVGTSHSLARADHAHQIQHGIADNHLVTVDHVTPVATDYARFTASGLEGREPSEVRTDLGLVIGTNVLAEQTIGIADNNLVEVDGPAAGAPASGEYARWTATGIEGRQKSEVLTDLNVADGADVTGSNPPQAHKDRHDPQDGADPLDCAAPAADSVNVAASAEGVAHSLARSDHTHNLDEAIIPTWAGLHAFNAGISIPSGQSIAGEVAFPNQPAFSVHMNGDDQAFNAGAAVTLEFDTETFDTGADFNVGTYKFVAPLNGKYLLAVMFRVDNLDTAAAYYSAMLITSNRNYYQTLTTNRFTGDPAYWSFVITAVADMDAADEAYVQIAEQVGGANQSTVEGTATDTRFMGWFLG